MLRRMTALLAAVLMAACGGIPADLAQERERIELPAGWQQVSSSLSNLGITVTYVIVSDQSRTEASTEEEWLQSLVGRIELPASYATAEAEYFEGRAEGNLGTSGTLVIRDPVRNFRIGLTPYDGTFDPRAENAVEDADLSADSDRMVLFSVTGPD